MAEKSPFRTSDPWLNCCLQVNALIDLFRSICVFGKLSYNRLVGKVIAAD